MKKKLLVAFSAVFLTLGFSNLWASPASEDIKKTKAEMRENAEDIKKMCEQFDKEMKDFSKEERELMSKLVIKPIQAMYFAAHTLKYNTKLANKANENSSSATDAMEKFKYPSKDARKLCWKTYELFKTM